MLPEILGQEIFGDYSLRFSPQNSPEILGRETLLPEITRDLNFLGNFGTVRPKFSRKFWHEFVLLSRVKFLGNFVHTKFREIWNRSSGRQILGNFVHTKFSEKFGTGALGLSCEIFRKFRGPKFPGNLGVKLSGNFVRTKFADKFGTGALGLSCEIFRKFRGPKFPGNLGVKFSRNFVVPPKFPHKFGTGALGLSCEIFRKFRGPKFP